MEVNVCPICKGQSFRHLARTKDFTLTGEAFTVQQCLNCSLGITSPRPADDKLSHYYESKEYISHAATAANLFDRIYLVARHFTLRWKHSILKKLSPNKNILDYGCGTAQLLGYLKKKGWSVCGVEPSAIARANADQNIDPSEVMEDLSQVTNTYDVITLWHVLEHIPQPEDLLRQLQRHLTPTGRILIAVPNLNTWESTKYGSNWAAYDTPRHLWHFTQDSMARIAKKTNLQIIEIIPMIQDAFYVSMLSEKYKNHGQLGVKQFAAGLINGFRSNLNARKTNEYSSLIYILKHETS
jgi:2-polyprenyl-3-methyl-5-hydroxy-6-metoxy-1,4-benzoquinol methylase